MMSFYEGPETPVGLPWQMVNEVIVQDCYQAESRLKPGARVIDVGANLGTFTLWAASHECYVLAVEADRDIYDALCANVLVWDYRTVEALWGAVGHASGEDGVGGRATLAPGEAAGDLADGVQPLLEVDRQREEVDVSPGLRAGAGRDQHDRLAQGDGDGAVRLNGEPPRLDDQGPLPDFCFVDVRHLFLFSLHLILTARRRLATRAELCLDQKTWLANPGYRGANSGAQAAVAGNL